MKLVLPAFVLLLATAVPAHAANKWLCVVEQSVGYKYEATDEKWRATFFDAGTKYLISPYEEATGEGIRWFSGVANSEYFIQEFGKDIPRAACQSFDTYGWLGKCESHGTEFAFNRDTLEFRVVYLVG